MVAWSAPPLTDNVCDAVKLGTVPANATDGGWTPHSASIDSVESVAEWPCGSVAVSDSLYTPATSGTKLAFSVFGESSVAVLPAGACVKLHAYVNGCASATVQEL